MRIETEGFAGEAWRATATAGRGRDLIDWRASQPGTPRIFRASTTGTIWAPELTAYCTALWKNSGVQPKGVGFSATSCVAKISQPQARRFSSMTSLIAWIFPG